MNEKGPFEVYLNESLVADWRWEREREREKRARQRLKTEVCTNHHPFIFFASLIHY